MLVSYLHMQLQCNQFVVRKSLYKIIAMIGGEVVDRN